jgi:hypothetical protein
MIYAHIEILFLNRDPCKTSGFHSHFCFYPLVYSYLATNIESASVKEGSLKKNSYSASDVMLPVSYLI